ncbi:MAG: hypothetical protein ACRC0L_04430 [Angustibacter sp.]
MTTWTPTPCRLSGTERQLNWAYELRRKGLLTAEFDLRTVLLAQEHHAQDALAWLASIGEAGWWLDRKELTGQDFALIALGATSVGLDAATA